MTAAKKKDAGAPAAPATMTVSLPPELLDRARDVVYFTPGMTLSGLATIAITREVQRMRRLHEKRNGEPIPSRGGKRLRSGPAIQSGR